MHRMITGAVSVEEAGKFNMIQKEIIQTELGDIAAYKKASETKQ